MPWTITKPGPALGDSTLILDGHRVAGSIVNIAASQFVEIGMAYERGLGEGVRGHRWRHHGDRRGRRGELRFHFGGDHRRS
jgi:hypothetical protein